ncbi:MAG: hypothetical protein PVG38_17085 [Gammaproteobacteria bacterium]|jgi:hypothetical protein
MKIKTLATMIAMTIVWMGIVTVILRVGRATRVIVAPLVSLVMFRQFL